MQSLVSCQIQLENFQVFVMVLSVLNRKKKIQVYIWILKPALSVQTAIRICIWISVGTISSNMKQQLGYIFVSIYIYVNGCVYTAAAL